MSKPGSDSMEVFKAFVAEFREESDRAAVILGAAKLDLLLYQILQKALRPCTSKSDELLDGDTPLGSFSSRIAICHRLGILDEHLTRSLHLVRRIRNSFAHELSGSDLNSGAHRDRIRELISPLKDNDLYKSALDRYFPDCTGPAGEFRAIVAILSLRLEGAFEALTPICLKKSWTLVPPAREIEKEEEPTTGESH